RCTSVASRTPSRIATMTSLSVVTSYSVSLESGDAAIALLDLEIAIFDDFHPAGGVVPDVLRELFRCSRSRLGALRDELFHDVRLAQRALHVRARLGDDVGRCFRRREEPVPDLVFEARHRL